MKLIIFIAVIGIILFFPIGISGSTCLFGYLTGICLSVGRESSAIMLNQYMRYFAIPWWISIGLAVWSFKKQQKLKQKINVKENFNA